ncbi:MAG: hypothetical protein WBO17_15395 [Sphingorhabdus sp.]
MPNAVLAVAATRKLREIAKRKVLFGEMVQAESGWALLLWILVLETDRVELTLALLCQKAGMDTRAGERWLALLGNGQLIDLERGIDGRAIVMIKLTTTGREKLALALQA